ncbi:MAG TPA: ribosome maturation factor RimM [Acidimicrobiia bacterium]|nr:ribosome maturation factor RimM [Acidimicrobiia bacterium]
MGEPAPRLEVGRIAKSHGLRGEVVLAPVTNRDERFVAGAVLYLDDQPLHIVTARPHQGRWLVGFAEVADRTAADALRGRIVTGDPLGPPPAGELWVHEVVGSVVVDRDGREIGRVRAVEANPAHDLLVLDDDTLVPMVFVVDQRDGVVVVEVPDGLLELGRGG